MFDIGFSELLLVGVVALLVFGPERLPSAARTAGLWIGRLKRSFAAIKTEVEREIGADEFRRQLHNENILQMEREQQARVSSSAAPGGDTPPASAAPAPSAEQANAPIAANSRLAGLPQYQVGAQAPAVPAATEPAQPDGQPAAPSEPPRPT